MATVRPRALIEVRYEAAAQEYLRNLPPEHFMEAIGQSTQREITLESLALVKAHRPDFHVFNEMLVQWERPGERKPGQVCPDNMVVLSKKPIRATGSYNLPLEPARPYWVLEYVSKNNKRKDYDDNFDKYEKELKVPYYLIFYPDEQELSVYAMGVDKYVSVQPNRHGRYPIQRVNIEVALLGGWVRFWHKGKLLPLPAELQRDLDAARRQLEEMRQQVEAVRQQAGEANRRVAALQRRLEEEQEGWRALEREMAQLRAMIEQQPERRANGGGPERRRKNGP